MFLAILGIIIILAWDIYIISHRIKDKKKNSLKDFFGKEFIIVLCLGLFVLGAGIYCITIGNVFTGIFLIVLSTFPFSFLF